MQHFHLKFKYGIDDLKGLYAYVGSWGNGDYYYSNEVGYDHPSYASFIFDCQETQEAVNAEISKRKIENEEYVQELKSTGQYGKEYTIGLDLKKCPVFDKTDKTPNPLGSYSFKFIDLTDGTKI